MEVIKNESTVKKEPLTNLATLYNYHLELQELKGSIIYQFNKQHISLFYKRNGFKIRAFLAELSEINNKYLVVEQGKANKTEVGELVFKEGADSAKYQKEIEALMTRKIEIKF